MLNDRQKKFADYFIECGNATEAARKAGYKEKSAYSIGSENLRKPEIAAYIEERTKPAEDKRIADADEVMMFYTSVMRGEVADQFGLEASLDTRLKAGESLMKRYIAAKSKDGGTAIQKLDKLLEGITREAQS